MLPQIGRGCCYEGIQAVTLGPSCDIGAGCCLQEARLRALYEKHEEDRAYLSILAEELPGGFSKGQISSQLRKLGLKKSKGKKAKGAKSMNEVSKSLGTLTQHAGTPASHV